jgi:hypothetical protein
MTKRIDIIPAPEPLEAYARHFDDLLGKSNQREGFRRYLEGLLLPTERQKTREETGQYRTIGGGATVASAKTAVVSL